MNRLTFRLLVPLWNYHRLGTYLAYTATRARVFSVHGLGVTSELRLSGHNMIESNDLNISRKRLSKYITKLFNVDLLTMGCNAIC